MASIASRRGSAVSGISSFFSEQDMRYMAASIVSASVSSVLWMYVRLFFMRKAGGGVENDCARGTNIAESHQLVEMAPGSLRADW